MIPIPNTINHSGRLSTILLAFALSGLAVSPFVSELPNGARLLATFSVAGACVALATKWLMPDIHKDPALKPKPDFGRAFDLFFNIIVANIGVGLIVLNFAQYLPSRPELIPGPGLDLLALFAVAVLLGPLVEEFMFRLVALREFKQMVSPRTAVIVVTFVFALAHVKTALFVLPGAYILTLARERSGSFWLSYLLHALSNGSLVALGTLAEPSGSSPSLELSVVWSIVTIAAGIIIMFWSLYDVTRSLGVPSAKAPEGVGDVSLFKRLFSWRLLAFVVLVVGMGWLG